MSEEVFVYIQDGENKRGEMTLRNATVSQKDVIVDKFFDVFMSADVVRERNSKAPNLNLALASMSMEEQDKLSKESFTPVKLKSRPLMSAETPAPIAPKDAFEMEYVEPPMPIYKTVVPKHLPNDTKIEGNPSSMEEVYNRQQDPNAPAFHKTGIKYKDFEGKSIPHYRCRYKCTKCENKGNHYIPEGVQQVDCHTCQATLHVKKATPGTVGIAPDKLGNWFVAGEQLPVWKFIDNKNVNKYPDVKKDIQKEYGTSYYKG